MMFRRFFWVAGIVILLSGCVQGTLAPTAEIPDSLGGRITFAGSTTVQPLADKIGQAFTQQHPYVTLDIAAGGSKVGIQAIHDGTTDIGMASRDLDAEEAAGIEQHQIAVDVIAVVVHASNPIEDLTLAQLQDIYMGKVINWAELGGPDVPIVTVVREENSGTRGAFDEIVLDKQEPQAPEMEKALTAGDMAAIVADNPAAIGYVGFGNLEAGLKTVAIEGVGPSAEAARDGSYRLVRPLLLLTGPLSQPLADTFIEFATSPEGQAVVEANGWVSVK
jgi:phosphate transport system substrate-binding protein